MCCAVRSSAGLFVTCAFAMRRLLLQSAAWCVLSLLVVLLASAASPIWAQNHTEDVRDGGPWATPVPEQLIEMAGLEHILQDRVSDILWYLNAPLGGGFYLLNTTLDTLTPLSTPGGGVVTSYDQDSQTRIVYLVIQSSIYILDMQQQQQQQPNGPIMVSSQPILSNPLWNITGISAEDQKLYVNLGGANRASQLLVYDLSLAGGGLDQPYLNFQSPRSCILKQQSQWMTLNRPTSEVFLTCGDEGVYSFSTADLLSDPTLVLSYFPCRAVGVSHDPVTGYYFQECNSIYVSTIEGDDATDFLIGLPTYFGCGSASVAFDWDKRVAYVMCRFLGIVAVQLDVDISDEKHALAVRLTSGWGVACSTGTAAAFDRLARPERNGNRVFMNCANGLNYIAGRTTVVIGEIVCRVPPFEPHMIAFDDTGRGYASCIDAGGLTVFDGLVGRPLQFNRSICYQPYLVQFSRMSGQRLLWFSCAVTVTSGYNIVTFNLDTQETKEILSRSALGKSNGAGQQFKIVSDGTLYFTQYPDLNLPHTLYRIAR